MSLWHAASPDAIETICKSNLDDTCYTEKKFGIGHYFYKDILSCIADSAVSNADDARRVFLFDVVLGVTRQVRLN